jgi:hypothetical protein
MFKKLPDCHHAQTNFLSKDIACMMPVELRFLTLKVIIIKEIVPTPVYKNEL